MNSGVRFLALMAMLLAAPLFADSPAEMLQKGIYTEDTVGNLDEAIKIYREVLVEAKQTNSLAAQAQFRLAQCLLKKGNTEEASEAFATLVKDYPDEKELVAQAKAHLPDELKLEPAPWEDGERSTLSMKLPNGQSIGLVGLAVDSGTLDGQDVWEMSVRRFVSAVHNEGVGRIILNKSTNRPAKTVWKHTVLGDSSAIWTDDKIVISKTDADGKTEENTVEYQGPAYSNDQWFFGFRQLPLKIGYKVTLPIRVAFTGGGPIGLEISVPKKENVETPVGKFECFRVETNIAQTFWVADVPERYLAKFEAGGVTAMLTSVTSKSGTKNQGKTNEPLGLSLEVPQGWFCNDLPTTNEDTSGGFVLVSPDMASIRVRVQDKSQLDSNARDSLKAWADSSIKAGKSAIKGVTIRAGSMQETALAGETAQAFTADMTAGLRKFSSFNTLAFQADKAIEMSAIGSDDQLASLEAAVKSVKKSLTVK